MEQLYASACLLHDEHVVKCTGEKVKELRERICNKFKKIGDDTDKPAKLEQVLNRVKILTAEVEQLKEKKLDHPGGDWTEVTAEINEVIEYSEEQQDEVASWIPRRRASLSKSRSTSPALEQSTTPIGKRAQDVDNTNSVSSSSKGASTGENQVDGEALPEGFDALKIMLDSSHEADDSTEGNVTSNPSSEPANATYTSATTTSSPIITTGTNSQHSLYNAST